MGEAVYAAADFEVYPAVVDYGDKVVFGDELVRDVVNFDATYLYRSSGVQR